MAMGMGVGSRSARTITSTAGACFFWGGGMGGVGGCLCACDGLGGGGWRLLLGLASVAPPFTHLHNATKHHQPTPKNSNRGNKFPNKWDTYDVEEELARLDAEEGNENGDGAGNGGGNGQKVGGKKKKKGVATLGRVRTEVGQLNHDLERVMGWLDQVRRVLCFDWCAFPPL